MAAVLVSAAAAAVVDLRTGRIPNAITLTATAAGFFLSASGVSGISVTSSALGFVLGALLLLPGHVFGGTGAGDVKLLGAVGTILGPGQIVVAFLYGAIAGGMLAIGYAVHRGRLGATLRQTTRLVVSAPAARREMQYSMAARRFPYGPAIAIGSVLAALSGS